MAPHHQDQCRTHGGLSRHAHHPPAGRSLRTPTASAAPITRAHRTSTCSRGRQRHRAAIGNCSESIAGDGRSSCGTLRQALCEPGFQDPILFAQERDHVGLLGFKPAPYGGDQQLERQQRAQSTCNSASIHTWDTAVTSVTTCVSTWRPSRCPSFAKRCRSPSLNRRRCPANRDFRTDSPPAGMR